MPQCYPKPSPLLVVSCSNKSAPKPSGKTATPRQKKSSISRQIIYVSTHQLQHNNIDQTQHRNTHVTQCTTELFFLLVPVIFYAPAWIFLVAHSNRRSVLLGSGCPCFPRIASKQMNEASTTFVLGPPPFLDENLNQAEPRRC